MGSCLESITNFCMFKTNRQSKGLFESKNGFSQCLYISTQVFFQNWCWTACVINNGLFFILLLRLQLVCAFSRRKTRIKAVMPRSSKSETSDTLFLKQENVCQCSDRRKLELEWLLWMWRCAKKIIHPYCTIGCKSDHPSATGTWNPRVGQRPWYCTVNE